MAFISSTLDDEPGLPGATADMGLEGFIANRVRSRYWPAPHLVPAQGQAPQLRVVLPARLAGTCGSGPWWPAGRTGRPGHRLCVLAAPLGAKAASVRLLTEHGVQVPGGVQLPLGRAVVDVGYSEPLPAGRLPEPVACAVRATDHGWNFHSVEGLPCPSMST